jgi:hypothetical protein
MSARMLISFDDIEGMSKTLRENIDICWTLAKDTPWKYEPMAATFECSLAMILGAKLAVGKRDPEIEELLDESIDIFRRYSEMIPGRYAISLSQSLYASSQYYNRAGKMDDSVLADAKEAVDLIRPIAEKEGAGNLITLAKHLENYGNCMERTISKDYPEADRVKLVIDCYEEAYSIMDKMPGLTAKDKMSKLLITTELALAYKKYVGKTKESSKLMKEAVIIGEELAKSNPTLYGKVPTMVKGVGMMLIMTKKGTVTIP